MDSLFAIFTYPAAVLYHLSPTTKLFFVSLAVLLPLSLAALYVRNDYQRFLTLGPGGTPATPLGYAKIKLLSFISLRDPLRPLPIPPHFRPQQGHLGTLPLRSGKRPVVQGIAPQRQQTQKSPREVYSGLVRALETLVKEPQNCLLQRTSCFEKHSSGLFASSPITRTCGGEVCHAHPSDGSLHMTLHPADLKLILENGWGERHPLAKGGWFRRFVPKEFMLIYAPRNEEDIEVVMCIVAASVWWVSGIDVVNGEKKTNREVAVGVLASAQANAERWTCRMHGCGRRSVEKMVADA